MLVRVYHVQLDHRAGTPYAQRTVTRHDDDTLWSDSPEHVEDAQLQAVADLEVASLEEAYMLTQHVNTHWMTAHAAAIVQVHQARECVRSTAVGDVLEDLATRRRWLVQRVGLAELL